MIQNLHPLPAAGEIRVLRPSDLKLFREHLLRLDAASRHDRFNGITDEEFVIAYAARCFVAGVTVIAHVEAGAVRGAAELHAREPGRRDLAEIAFSVEADWQHRGIGSRLFARLIEQADALGYRELLVTTHSQNEAMKALARKFGARLSFTGAEASGLIHLDAALPAGSVAGARATAEDGRAGAQSAAAAALGSLARAVVDLHLRVAGLDGGRSATEMVVAPRPRT